MKHINVWLSGIERFYNTLCMVMINYPRTFIYANLKKKFFCQGHGLKQGSGAGAGARSRSRVFPGAGAGTGALNFPMLQDSFSFLIFF